MNKVMTSLIFAGLMIGASVGMRIGEAHGLVTDAGERTWGVLLGLILAWFANAIPKGNQDEFERCGDDVRLRLFAGRALIIGGFAHSLIWIFAPIGQANLAAMVVVAAALSLVLIQAFSRRTTP